MALLPLFLYVRKKPLVKYFISINSLKHFFTNKGSWRDSIYLRGKKKNNTWENVAQNGPDMYIILPGIISLWGLKKIAVLWDWMNIALISASNFRFSYIITLSMSVE